MNLLFKLCIHTFKSYNLPNLNNFSDLASKINNNNIIKTATLLLNLLLYNKNNIYTKYFLSCFMIIKHPKVIISHNTEIEKNIIYLSNKLTEILNNLYILDFNKYPYYKVLFNLYYTKYIDEFKLWKDYDKKKIINDLCTIYFELESSKLKRNESKDKTSNETFIKDIENEQKKIKEKLYKINKEDAIIHLNTLKKEMEKYKEKIHKLYEKIETNLHDAYWSIIEEGLNREPPNTNIIGELLTQLKEMIISCNPNIKTELDQNIDIPFIQQMMQNNAIDDKYLFNTCNYIITILQSLQSKSHDDSLLSWKQDIFSQFEKGCKYSKFLTLFFKGIFEKFQTLLYEIDLFNLYKKNLS